MYFNYTNVSVNCHKLFNIDYLYEGHGLKESPRWPPNELLNEYTMNGRIHLHKYFWSLPYLNNDKRKLVWSEHKINEQIKLAKNGTLHGTYGVV